MKRSVAILCVFLTMVGGCASTGSAIGGVIGGVGGGTALVVTAATQQSHQDVGAGITFGLGVALLSFPIIALNALAGAYIGCMIDPCD